MRLAVISDIHGNATALAAVLVDVRAAAPDAIVNRGDCFSSPLDVARTADLFHSAFITATVMGNHDLSLLDHDDMDDEGKTDAGRIGRCDGPNERRSQPLPRNHPWQNPAPHWPRRWRLSRFVKRARRRSD